MTSHKLLSQKEKLDWIQLIRCKGIGPVRFHQLLERFESADKVLEALPALMQRGKATSFKLYPRQQVNAEWETAQKHKATLLFHCEPSYPAHLKRTTDAPPLLYAFGHPHLLQEDSLSIVGTRNASLSAVQFTTQIAEKLGQEGFVIASGFASGIDTAAHKASLQTGSIAVFAGGLDVIYPRENEALFHAFCDRGLILAENPLGTTPQARHFPSRNRIIAGLSLGVIVMEAAAKSGSMITAHYALEQGREVFAVPGSPLDPRCQGTNALIREGATLVTKVEDILENLPGHLFFTEPPATQTPPPPVSFEDKDLERVHQKINTLLSLTPVSIEDLIQHSNEPVALVQAALSEIEIAGRLYRLDHQKVALSSL